MTPEQKDARLRRLVSAAKAVLSLQVGFSVGARRIENVLRTLGSDFLGKHEVFSQFREAIPLDIPLGSARLFWEPDAMLRTDLKLASVEKRYRTKLLAECVNIIRLYG